jgi:hypothetical protein
MKHLTTSYMTAATFAALVALAGPAQADSIAVTYNLTGMGTVENETDTTLTLAANANGSILSGTSNLDAAWNPVSYSDLSVLDFTTNLLNGNFTLLLADGDTLTGTIFEDQTIPDTSPTQTGPFSQILTFTGGTGAFAGANGSVSGQGFLGATEFTVVGSGKINTPEAPEPTTVTLFAFGLALASTKWWRPRGKNSILEPRTGGL